MTMDGDEIDDILQEKSDYISSGDQRLNYVGKAIIEIGLDTMASTSDILPQDLIVEDSSQVVTQ